MLLTCSKSLCGSDMPTNTVAWVNQDTLIIERTLICKALMLMCLHVFGLATLIDIQLLQKPMPPARYVEFLAPGLNRLYYR